MAGGTVSDIGTWLQRITQDWIVLELTDSALAVGVTMALQSLPLLVFGLGGGLIADRFPKRRVLMCTQGLMGLLTATLAVLAFTRSIQVWQIYVIAFLEGLVSAVDNPTRQAFLMELVGPDGVVGAVSLNSAAAQLAKIAGPTIAGFFVERSGGAWNLGANALSYIGVVVALLLIRNEELFIPEEHNRGNRTLMGGLRHVLGNSGLILPISVAAVVGTFGYNFPIFLSSFTKIVFSSNATAYGTLNALLAVGSVAGAFLAARRKLVQHSTFLIAALCFGTLEIAASFAPNFTLFGAALTLTGMCGLLFTSGVSTSLQTTSEPGIRGQVMSLYVIVIVGSSAVGGPFIGWVAATFGPRAALALGGALSLLAGAAGFSRLRSMNSRVPAAPPPSS